MPRSPPLSSCVPQLLDPDRQNQPSGGAPRLWHKASRRRNASMTIVITRQLVESWVLNVDGHLSGEDTDVLLRACEGIVRAVLDLSDLRSAGRRGVDVLRELRSRGAIFTGLSPYLDLLLGTARVPDRPDDIQNRGDG